MAVMAVMVAVVAESKLPSQSGRSIVTTVLLPVRRVTSVKAMIYGAGLRFRGRPIDLAPDQLVTLEVGRRTAGNPCPAYMYCSIR